MLVFDLSIDTLIGKFNYCTGWHIACARGRTMTINMVAASRGNYFRVP